MARGRTATDLPCWRGSRLWRYGLGSFLFGYLVLHPVSMSIFRALDAVHMHHHGPPSAGGLLMAALESFHPEMIPMGLLFGAFCAAIGLVLGCQRAALDRQRDQLATQLSVTQSYREELEKTVARLRELDRTNRRATRFMVHDFKNHLGVILGSVELLGEVINPLDPREREESLARIRRQAHRMLAGVSDLLDLARLDGGADLRRSWLRPSELLAEVIADLSLPPGGQLRLGDGHHLRPAVFLDARLITRVLVNLASNAFNHNPQGTRVTLDALPGAAEGETLFVCRDDGNGIPPELAGTIFDEFCTSSSHSSGLGLAFCKSAVEAHGGRIWCEAAPDRGTAFLVSLPAAASPAREQQESAPQERGAPAPLLAAAGGGQLAPL